MLGERIKKERERLDLNQSEFAESCGIKRNAQIKYESGERQPKSDYLQKASDMGVDVSYLFTGIRTPQIELEVTQKLNTAIEQAIAEDNLEGAKNLQEANEEMQTARIKRAENHHRREDEIRQIIYCLSELDDETFERMENTVKDVWMAKRTKSEQPQTNEPVNNPANHQVNSSINNAVVNSPHANISNSFNQSGFTELPFLIATTICGLMSWLLGTLANIKAMTDTLMSMAFGIPAVVLWMITLVLAVFGHYASKRQYEMNVNKDMYS